MIFRTFLITFLIVTVSDCFGQLTLEKMCQHVLLKNKIDEHYSFNESKKTDRYMETILTYLGSVSSDSGRIFKVLTYEFIWGPNHHTSGSIYIFNYKNRYVGKYHLGGGIDLPVKLQNGNLIFTNDNNSCDKKLRTSISLKKGLPKEIFIKCQGNLGDLYSFSKETIYVLDQVDAKINGCGICYIPPHLILTNVLSHD